MSQLPSRTKPRRRGAIAVLAAFFCVILLGMVAFAVDIGYIATIKTQLQAVADSTALAAAAAASQNENSAFPVAQDMAARNKVAGRAGKIADSCTADVQFGLWNAGTATFTPPPLTNGSVGNAVKVTVRTDATNGGLTPLFFGRLFGRSGVTQEATAIATMNPRDICFVVDLSASMHTDTEPDYPNYVPALVNQIYQNFSYSATSGSETTKVMGQLSPLNVTSSDGLTKTITALTNNNSVNTRYKIGSSDPTMSGSPGDSSWVVPNSGTKQWKAYAWTIDNQIASVMPGVKPTPSSYNAGSFAYWSNYLSRNYLNYSTYTWEYNYNKIGYRSYLRFMMQRGGGNLKPGGTLYTPLSYHSSDHPTCPDTVGTVSYNFPAWEMPTHAARRAIIAAIQVIDSRNKNITDPQQRDWVSVISFNVKGSGAVIEVPLRQNSSTTGNPVSYADAISGNSAVGSNGCVNLQACADYSSSSGGTTTDQGLIAAVNHIKYGGTGLGRQQANKIIVLLTDGLPNDHSSLDGDITNYKGGHSSSYWTGDNNKDAALMQTAMMQGNNWYLYAAGLGANCDTTFMNSMACMGGTDVNGNAPTFATNSYQIEASLTSIFNNIIQSPKLRLVK
jgi:Flp pilus assembly protein TadG